MQLDMLSKYTQEVTLRIAIKKTSAMIKAMVYDAYVLARLLYFKPHLTSTLGDIQEKIDNL